MGSSFRVLHSFHGHEDGQGPTGGLLDVDGTLYGITEIGGTVYHGMGLGAGVMFSVDMQGHEKILRRFEEPNIAVPSNVTLVRIGTEMYGTTSDGGAQGGSCTGGYCGTVFAIDDSGDVRILHNFSTQDNNGYDPQAGLVYSGGQLYGTTMNGDGYGVVFQINPSSGAYKVLHRFVSTRDGDGMNPNAPLIALKGTLYGITTTGGGANCNDIGTIGCGTIFSITRAGTEKILHRFQGGADGAYPQAGGLMEYGGALYGTTYFGGNVGSPCPGGCGTVFRYDLATKRHHVLYSFKGGNDGMQPTSGLTWFHGAFYGTTALGGSGGCFPYSSCGTIFRITTSGQEMIVHTFRGDDGYEPWGGRLLTMGGALFGETYAGGAKCEAGNGCGTVFEYSP
jgi:uncharacterized repeat protein (TIGR03803 family)